MTTRGEAEERVSVLLRLIRHHDRQYYVLARPEISDFEYDQLFAELRRLEEQFPELVTEASPTQRVAGEPLAGLEQAAHAIPMLSLDNTYSRAELAAWYGRAQRQIGATPAALAAELKIDGVSISLLYEVGRLVRAVTRGDGRVGDDVTANARTIRQLPLVVEGAPPRMEVRGEVYMRRSTFAELNTDRRSSGEAELANPRNAAAGSIRLLDPRAAARRRLSLWCYQVVDPAGGETRSHVDRLEWLRGMGFPVSPGVVRCADLAAAEAVIDDWEMRRRELDFDIDGVVIKLDRTDEQQALGATARAVRWAVAYKYPPEGKTTVVRNIVIQVGRTGVLTPVAVLEPVVVSGSTVARATLHNFDEVERLDVRLGDTVWVSKGGEVIPKVQGVVTGRRPADATPLAVPQACPGCGEPVVREAAAVALRCVNPDCPAVAASRLRHFVSRGAMDIDGLGGRLLDQLVSRPLVTDPASLWDLRPEQLHDLPGWGEVSAANLTAQLEDAKTRPLHRLVFALGIPHVGQRAARLLARRFRRMSALAEATEETVEAIDGIGPVMAAAVVAWFADTGHQGLLKRLRERGVDPEEPVEEPHGPAPLSGLTIVITGSLSRSRPEINRRLVHLGGTVSGSVSRGTSYLVAGTDAGSKLRKAVDLDVPVLDEAALDALVRERGGNGLWEQ